jgi:hypothetical protein
MDDVADTSMGDGRIIDACAADIGDATDAEFVDPVLWTDLNTLGGDADVDVDVDVGRGSDGVTGRGSVVVMSPSLMSVSTEIEETSTATGTWP